ncbi:hypothetical protein N9993_00875 [bacterium]|nr:hypothetical protein [bacterium]
MAETEILNVGGPQGVASEATLLKLIDLTRQQQRGQGSAAQAEAKLRQTHNAAIKKGSENVGVLGKAAQAGAKAFDTYTKVLKDGVGGVSDFTDSMKFLPSTMKSLIRFADASTHQFRELSQVGAGFSNSIFEMNKVAATSGMAMTDFYETVQANSQTMRFLSGSVQEGAKRFAEVSHGLRSSDLGETLFNMGFSIGEINEGFLTYTNNMQRQGMLQGMTNRQLIEGSADYLKQIDLLSKATGASRKEFMNQTEALQESSKFQALIARAGEGAGDLTNNMAFAAQMLGAQFTDDLGLISEGSAGLTDLGKALTQVNGGDQFIKLLENMDSMDPNQFGRQFSALAPTILDSITSMSASRQAMLERSGSPIAAIFDTVGGFAKAANMDFDAIEAQQKREDAITGAFTGFQQAVADLSKFITDNFLKSETFKSLKELGTSLSASFATLFGPVSQDGSFKNASEGISSFVTKIDTFIKENLIDPITQEVNTFTAHMANNGDAGTYFKEKLVAAGNKILDFFLGTMDETGVRGSLDSGLFSKISTAISSVFEDEGFRARIKGMFSDVALLASDSIAGWFDSEAAKASLGELKNGILKAMGFKTEEGSKTVFEQFKDRVLGEAASPGDSLMKRIETKIFGVRDESQGEMSVMGRVIDELITGITNAFASESFQTKMDEIVDTLRPVIDSAIRNLLEALNSTFLGYFIPNSSFAGAEEQQSGLADQLRILAETPDLGYAAPRNQGETDRQYIARIIESGNLGGAYAESGRDILGQLGNLEANNPNLVPIRHVGTLRATGKTTEPEGGLMNISQGERVLNPSEAASYNSQSDLGGAINRLNTTTAQLVTLMKQNNRITSGISNDFLKGSLTV